MFFSQGHMTSLLYFTFWAFNTTFNKKYKLLICQRDMLKWIELNLTLNNHYFSLKKYKTTTRWCHIWFYFYFSLVNTIEMGGSKSFPLSTHRKTSLSQACVFTSAQQFIKTGDNWLSGGRSYSLKLQQKRLGLVVTQGRSSWLQRWDFEENNSASMVLYVGVKPDIVCPFISFKLIYWICVDS